VLRFLPAFIELALLIYCLVDCIQTDESRVRNLPKVGWILLIIILPIVGGVAWLVAGRPKGPVPGGSAFGPAAGRSGSARSGRPAPVAPEDDPAFMRGLEHPDPEKERLLAQWEADLKRREEQLRPLPVTPPTPSTGGDSVPGAGTDAPDRPDTDAPDRPDTDAQA